MGSIGDTTRLLNKKELKTPPEPSIEIALDCVTASYYERYIEPKIRKEFEFIEEHDLKIVKVEVSDISIESDTKKDFFVVFFVDSIPDKLYWEFKKISGFENSNMKIVSTVTT